MRDTAPSQTVLARRGVWRFLLLGVVLLALGLASWRPVPAGVWNDDGVYVLVGKALAQGDGLSYAGVPGSVPAVKFPPIYPLVLAALWSVLSDIGPVTLSAVFLNLLLLAGAGTLLAFALQRSQALDNKAAIAVAGVAFMAADVWRLGLVPLSESLFIALMAAALACWADASRASDRFGAALLSVILTVALLTRSAGVALVLGFAISLVLSRGVRAAAAIVGPPVAVGFGWNAWASARSATIPEGMRDILGPYGGWLTEQLLDAPVEFLLAMPSHLREITRLIFTLLLPGLSGPVFLTAAILLGGLIAYGLLLLRRRFTPITWVALAYGAMLLVWPFVDRRLVTPLHPLLVVAICVSILELWRTMSQRSARMAFACAAALWVSAHAGVSAWRAYDGWAAAPYRLRSEQLATAVETLRQTAPANAIVGAPEFWAALHLHGGWPAVPSALFIPRSSEGVPVWGTPDDQIALWWVAGVEYLVLESGGRIHGDALDFVEQRCPGAVGIVARMPPQVLVHIRWSGGCASALGLEPRSS